MFFIYHDEYSDVSVVRYNTIATNSWSIVLITLNLANFCSFFCFDPLKMALWFSRVSISPA